MQVERNKTPEKRKLVRCSLFEATHFMSGQPIVKLIRDTTGWLAYSNDGIAESHIREDGIAYVSHPDDIAESDFHAGKYEIDPAEDTVTITLNAQEAATLQTILGKFNSLNDPMKVYVLFKQYNTGAGGVEQIFSSRKKAQAHLDWIIDMDTKDGWTCSKQWLGCDVVKYWNGRISNNGIMCLPPSGDFQQGHQYYILTEEVA